MNRLIAAFAVIVVFMIVETVGGVLAGSLALLADAAHMLTDAVALGLAASAHWFSRRPADERLHFGYRRAQVLAAFANGLFLLFLLVWIVIEAVGRLQSSPEVKWGTMLVIALLGLAANAVAFFILNRGHTRDLNVRGALLHVVSDMLGSVAAVIAALVIATTGWMRIDPILSIMVAGLIAYSAYRLIREAGFILLEGAPRHIDVTALQADLKASSPEIVDVHEVRIWQLAPEHARLTLHACVEDPAQGPDALAHIKSYLEERYGIAHSTIQIEVAGTCCPDRADGSAPQASFRAQEAPAPRRREAGPASTSAPNAAFVGQK
ncbi:MAG: CDF family zinc transporter ZitB [Amphiplicatus sp.]